MMEDFGLMRVVDVEYLHDYVMKLEFSNGDVRLVNFEPFLHGKFFDELRDKKKFIQFALTPWTLEWYNGVDFAPEFLYENSIPVDNDASSHADYAAEDRAPYNEG
ncbi:MAG: DUF2442 domain-containing protein [Bacteroidales bacterium]|nr:DUF2442 domain-containing protein [Bacteroidales bacterium]